MSDNGDEEAKSPGMTPGTEEYNARMTAIGKGEADPRDTPAPKEHALPEGGYDKFFNKETGEYDWKSHAVEADFKLKNKGTKEDPPSNPENPDKPNALTLDKADSPDNKAADESEVKGVIAKSGLEMADLQKSIVESGKLTDDQMAALVEKGGIDRELIEEYVGLAKFRVEQARKDALSEVGGEEAWLNISAWAQTNLSKEERARYNALLSSDNWQVAVRDLKGRMAADTPGGREGHLMQGDAAGGSLAAFESHQEFIDAIQSERYAKDAKFRDQVARRRALSTF